MKASLRSLVRALVIMCSAASVRADLSWSFVPPVRTVTPGESMEMTARLENTSDASILIESSPGSFTGDFQKIYDFTPVIDLFGRRIPANGSLDFNYGRLSPVGGSVAPGTYVGDPAFLSINGSALFVAKSRFTVQVVPEPDVRALTLLALGCAGSGWLLRRGSRRDPQPL